MRKYLFFIIAVVTCAVVHAQNNTSSPYSRFGYGELSDNIPGAYRAMGGVGVAMRDNRVINPSNPASISSCDSMTFMFDLAASGGWTNYSDATGTRNRGNGNLEYLTLQLPLWSPYLAFSAGILPYSHVGYDIKTANTVNEACHDTATYVGTGGFTQVYGGLSVNLFNWFAFGANIYYMFGDVTNLRSVHFAESEYRTISETSVLHANAIRLRYGAQLFHTFGQHTVILGGIFENKKNFNCNYSIIETTTADTVTAPQGFDLPMTYGVGLTYCFDQRLTLSADMVTTDWAKVRYAGNAGTLRTRTKWAFGAQYRHSLNGRKYYENMYFRVGASLSDSYIPQVTAKDFAVSVGVGFPLRNVATIINTSIEYNHRGAATSLQEHSLRLTINASISETWFFKRRL